MKQTLTSHLYRFQCLEGEAYQILLIGIALLVNGPSSVNGAM